MTHMEALRRRADIVRSVRAFFDERGYLAAETPQLAQRPIPEAHIELFETRYLPPDYRGAEPVPLYLLPSPEYYLKKLLAAGSGSLYEITHSFRNAESVGPQHCPEFTMLEYYTVDADGDDSLAITVELLRELGITGEPLILAMEEAFDRYAGVELARILEEDRTEPDGSIIEKDEYFQRMFLTQVEPELPADKPVFLTRYPAAVPTLARTIPGTIWADRWELYMGGMEVANCFGEETSPERIGAFFAVQEAEKRRNCRIHHPVEGAYLGAGEPLPRSSGVAMGVDRLVMYLLGVTDIERVLSFTLLR